MKIALLFSKKWFFVIIIVLVTGGIIYLSGFGKTKTSLTSPISFSPSKETQETSAPKNEPLPDGWLTYTNDTFHYQISYHPDWHAQGENEPPYPPPPAGKSFSYKWDNDEWCDFGILSFNGPDANQGEIDSIRQQGSDVESKTTLDSIQAIVFDTMGGEAISKTFYLVKGDISYRLGYNYKVGGKHGGQCADVVNTMLASFKFL